MAQKNFYRKGLKKNVKTFVQKHEVCQRNKTKCIKPTGLPQLLPVPNKVWSDIFIDFIEGLPPSDGFTAVLVVVDSLNKYAYFIPIAHPYTTSKIT